MRLFVSGVVCVVCVLLVGVCCFLFALCFWFCLFWFTNCLIPFSSHKSCGVFPVLVEGHWTYALTYVLVRRVSLRLLNLDCRYPRDLLQPAREKKWIRGVFNCVRIVYIWNDRRSCHGAHGMGE